MTLGYVYHMFPGLKGTSSPETMEFLAHKSARGFRWSLQGECVDIIQLACSWVQKAFIH